MDFEFRSDLPVYLQIAGLFENRIISGEYQPGDKLPSVREIALETRTNPNTVQKAMQELENRALIETRRTSGRFVLGDSKILEQERYQKAAGLTREFVCRMRMIGCSPKQIRSLLEKELNDES